MTKPPLFSSLLEPSWQEVLKEELGKPYFAKLMAFIEKERSGHAPIYPSQDLIFNAFFQTPYDKVKVVIVGQDPYHGPGQAQGLSFSVPHGIAIPPSLKNIFKELRDDLGIEVSKNGCLLPWAKQGVLLLNTTLTVQEGKPLSHARQGWEAFTDQVILALNARKDPVIFALWGKSALEKCAHLDQSLSTRHYVLTAAHPSPFSAHRGFFGCRHFSKINAILSELGKTAIDWEIRS